MEAIGCLALEGKGLGDSKAAAGFSTCRERYGGVCDLISGRQRHTTQKEWYAERQTYTQRERQTDIHMHTCREGGEERDRG